MAVDHTVEMSLLTECALCLFLLMWYFFLERFILESFTMIGYYSAFSSGFVSYISTSYFVMQTVLLAFYDMNKNL